MDLHQSCTQRHERIFETRSASATAATQLLLRHMITQKVMRSYPLVCPALNSSGGRMSITGMPFSCANRSSCCDSICTWGRQRKHDEHPGCVLPCPSAARPRLSHCKQVSLSKFEVANYMELQCHYLTASQSVSHDRPSCWGRWPQSFDIQP